MGFMIIYNVYGCYCALPKCKYESHELMDSGPSVLPVPSMQMKNEATVNINLLHN